MLGNAFFLGLGKPRLASHVSVLRLVLLAGLLYPAVQWNGLTGAATAVTAAAIVAGMWQLALLTRLVGPSLREFAETMTVGLLGSLLIATAAVLATPALSLSFLVYISAAMLAYLALLFRALRDRYGLLSAWRWSGLYARS
jgi:O-antigen/teichoic acid export membrane protein